MALTKFTRFVPSMKRDCSTRDFPMRSLVGSARETSFRASTSGNSPAEYTAAVQDRRIITTTTNGTVALRACDGAERVLLGALLNLASLAAELRSLGPATVLLVCAGTFDMFALEDAYAAGRLIAEFPGAT